MSEAVATAWVVAAACGLDPCVPGGRCETITGNDSPPYSGSDCSDTAAAADVPPLATEHSFTDRHRAAVFALAVTPGAYPSELAKTCGVTAMEMIDLMNELLAWGLISRVAPPAATAA